MLEKRNVLRGHSVKRGVAFLVNAARGSCTNVLVCGVYCGCEWTSVLKQVTLYITVYKLLSHSPSKIFAEFGTRHIETIPSENFYMTWMRDLSYDDDAGQMLKGSRFEDMHLECPVL